MENRTKPTKLPLHDFPIESFIGGTYIPDQVCDELVEHFESNPDKQVRGTVHANPNAEPNLFFENDTVEQTPGDGVSRTRLVEDGAKKSIDMGFSPMTIEEDQKILNNYFFYLNQCISEYEFKYPQVKQLAHYGTTEGLNIQKYNPGDGFYEWHQERNGKGTMTRCFVHMTYLNDVEDGGTEFWFQKMTTPAKKGLTLIWPADWTHLHRGQISKTETKYILTGWLNYRD